MFTEPTFAYRISILEEPNPLDGREFPSKTACIKALWEVQALDDQILYELLSGGETTLHLTAGEIVKFHHTRRAYGTCPRLKWRYVPEKLPEKGPPTEEAAKPCGCS